MMAEIYRNVLPNGNHLKMNKILKIISIYSLFLMIFSDNLRELCNTFRHLLYELAKCVSVCEHDLNESLVEQLNKFDILQNVDAETKRSRPSTPTEVTELNQSVASSIASPTKRAMRMALVPDVSGILSLIEDPSLVDFVTDITNQDESADELNESKFDLNSCLEKLKIEADTLLEMSEKIAQKRILDNKEVDRNASLEEEDGLKSKKDFSLNGNFSAKNEALQQPRLSLPNYLPTGERKNAVTTSSELNEMKNQLVKAEQQRQQLEQSLTRSLTEQGRLTEELRLAHIKLNSYIDGQSEELSEG